MSGEASAPVPLRGSMQVLPGGATRSEEAPRYDLVPREGIRRIALRYTMGAKKHGEGNWKKSCQTESNAREFCQAAYNHMMEHAQKMAAGDDPKDDHLGAIGWAVTVLAYCEGKFQKYWWELEAEEPIGT